MKSILKKTLNKQGVSVTKLADNTGVSRSLLSQLANSNEIPGKTRMDVIQKIMAYLQCDMFKIMQLETTNLEITSKMEINQYQAEKEVFKNEDGSSIIQEYGSIDDTSFAVISLELEKVKLQFPLLISTYVQPRSYSVTAQNQKKIFDERLLMGDIVLINYADIKLLKKQFPTAYNAIPKEYDYKSAFKNILEYPFLLKKMTNLLIDEKLIKFEKYNNAGLFSQISASWASYDNGSNLISFDVTEEDNGSYKLALNGGTTYPHSALSDAVLEKKSTNSAK